MKLPGRSAKKPSAKSTGKAAAGRIRIAHLGVVLVLLGGLLIAAATAFLQLRMAAAIHQIAEREAVLAADSLAAPLAAVLSGYASRLQALADDPDVSARLLRADQQQRDAVAAALRGYFPHALQLRVLPAGFDQIDDRADPPLGYAVVDMVRQAESSAAVPPAEIHLGGGEREHVNLLRRIDSPSGQSIVAHLLLSLPLDTFRDQVVAGRLQGGYLQWQQTTAKGDPLVLAEAGASQRKQGRPGATAAVPGSRWQVAFWPPQAPDVASVAFYGMVSGVSIALFVLLVVLLVVWWHKSERQDRVLLLGAVRDGLKGRLQASYGLRLHSWQAAVEDLRPLFQHLRAGDGGRQAPADAPKQEKAAAVDKKPAAPAAATLAPTRAPTAPPDIPDPSELTTDEQLLDPSLFRAYDIRGVFGETLTVGAMTELGQAVGSEVRQRGMDRLLVARDGRTSSPELAESFIFGVLNSGCHVIELGEVPTPVLYYALQERADGCGVMVTGSHNPAQYNGLKIVIGGITLSGNDIQALRRRVENDNYLQGTGQREKVDVLDDYRKRVTEDVVLVRPLKLVIDCGNGVAGAVAPELFRELGCTVHELYCDVDGRFPNHHPDPGVPANMADLQKAVVEQSADLGIAFDGDGDRLGVVDSGGKIIWPDRVLMLLAMDVLGRNPGAEVIYDVKSTRHLAKVIRDFGGHPEMYKTGHSLIKARMRETGALLAGEMSGHIFFGERWYGFDDALYAGARLLEVLSADHRSSESAFSHLPESVSTPELCVPMCEGEPEALMGALAATGLFEGTQVYDIDGLRVEFDDGWGLVRASNTMPNLVLRFEADDEEALHRIQELFRGALEAAKPDLGLPF